VSCPETLAQKINQADISVLRKAQIKENLGKYQKAYMDETKAREKATSKAVSAI
jgi:hypothetical protein